MPKAGGAMAPPTPLAPSGTTGLTRHVHETYRYAYKKHISQQVLCSGFSSTQEMEKISSQRCVTNIKSKTHATPNVPQYYSFLKFANIVNKYVTKCQSKYFFFVWRCSLHDSTISPIYEYMKIILCWQCYQWYQKKILT